jgi:hypothetical protein
MFENALVVGLKTLYSGYHKRRFQQTIEGLAPPRCTCPNFALAVQKTIAARAV